MGRWWYGFLHAQDQDTDLTHDVRCWLDQITAVSSSLESVVVHNRFHIPQHDMMPLKTCVNIKLKENEILIETTSFKVQIGASEKKDSKERHAHSSPFPNPKAIRHLKVFGLSLGIRFVHREVKAICPPVLLVCLPQKPSVRVAPLCDIGHKLEDHSTPVMTLPNMNSWK